MVPLKTECDFNAHVILHQQAKYILSEVYSKLFLSS